MECVDSQGEAAFSSAVLWSRRFPNRWALLNASDEEIREIAQADPWPFDKWSAQQIEELINFVRAFREIYTLVAKGPLHGKDAQRFSTVSDIITEGLDDFFAGLRPQLLQIDGDTLAFQMSGGPGPYTLLDHVGDKLLDLFQGLQGANSSSVFVCEWCGRIGPARYKNKRFCDANCRAAAAYRRKRGE